MLSRVALIVAGEKRGQTPRELWIDDENRRRNRGKDLRRVFSASVTGGSRCFRATSSGALFRDGSINGSRVGLNLKVRRYTRLYTR